MLRAPGVELVAVIPCYNEARRLDAAALLAFAARHPRARLLFVDDGSTDGTAAVLQDLATRCPSRMSVMSLAQNSGKAEAVRQGLQAGIRSGSDLVAYWDADLATPLSAMDDFQHVLRHRREVEVAVGSRVRLLGRSVRRRGPRHYAGRLFATVASLVLGLPVYDTQCGAKVFRVTAALRAALARPFRARWIFDVELLGRMMRFRADRRLPPLEAVTYELVLKEWQDVDGSKLHVRDYCRAAMDLGLILLEMHRGRSPAWSDWPVVDLPELVCDGVQGLAPVILPPGAGVAVAAPAPGDVRPAGPADRR